ncbi:DUF1254 domain-containing protein [Gammaproteobacteria bacterium]|nr:DUF1254 domain-containing protein [Gammaproteobacteria bacterium]
MKMTTDIPAGIKTPDKIETRFGDMTFFDGVPDKDTIQKVYNNLDFQHGFQAFLSGIQIASMDALRKGILKFGPANTTAILFEDLMDSKAFFLTANTTSVYQMLWLQLKDEPMVIETPPDVLGIIDNHWFKYVTDFGRLGPDKGLGGKFLIVPPGYIGDIPKGYHVAYTKTYGNWVIWRGFQVNGSTKTAVDATKKKFRVYPLSQKNNPPKMNFVNASGKFVNTIHRMDYRIFDEMNAVVQAEPSYGENPEILGVLASIGIKKGETFNPDARMKKILTQSAIAGAVTVKTIWSYPRNEMFYFYPGKSNWMNPFPGGKYNWVNNGATLLNARAGFHFYATGITPAMSLKIIGKGSKYAYTYKDADSQPLNGNKTYKLNIPANVPAKDFWSLTLYDNQTRSMLQTDQKFPGIDNKKSDIVKNSDGSYDIYFGPVAPKGKENNWIQTIPGKSWNVILRLYGPLEGWYNKTWRPGEVELIK